MMMKIVQNHTSVCTVTDNAGNFLGNIVRQKGSTLWSLRKAGVCRPFKRNIPSLTQAKKLVLDHPEMFTDPVWDWREHVECHELFCALDRADHDWYLVGTRSIPCF